MVEDFPPFLIYRSCVQDLVSTFDLDNVVNYNTSTMYCLTHISLKNIKDSWERERKRERELFQHLSKPCYLYFKVHLWVLEVGIFFRWFKTVTSFGVYMTNELNYFTLFKLGGMSQTFRGKKNKSNMIQPLYKRPRVVLLLWQFVNSCWC